MTGNSQTIAQTFSQAKPSQAKPSQAMKNIKRIIVLIFILLFQVSSLVFADNAVDSFDIKGVHLGDNYNQIKNKLPCNNVKTSAIGEMQWIRQVGCGGYTIFGQEFVINFDHDSNVVSVVRNQKFEVEPNFQKIKEQIYSKYGEPDAIGSIRTGIANPNNGSEESFCWGYCSNKNGDTPYFEGSSAEPTNQGLSFNVRYYSYPKLNQAGVEIYNDYEIHFMLENHILSKANDEWIEQEGIKYKDKLKDKASNLAL
ncbi:MAG: hypothetical protein HOP02_08740 [Methylococcaceae bacterium]|nr:hypothetical protein [Methylococcaceae bacterium]